jgi:hypothetical protein
MRAPSTAIAIVALLVVATMQPAGALPPPVSTEPGATVLLPYFQVELPRRAGKKAKRTTVFAVHNAVAEPTLVHVTLWSDLSVPVLAFDLYLTGYDMITIDVADILNGRMPKTGPNEVPAGPFSVPNAAFPGCGEVLPLPDLDETVIEHLRTSLTGRESALFGGCAGRDLGDRKPTARGYVTIDVVNGCSLLFPDAPGYFVSGGVGIAANRNVLFGDYFYVDGKQVRPGGALVPIRADDTDPETSVPGEYTFYGKGVGYLASDNRQHLPTTFGFRYVNVRRGQPLQSTSLVVWRDAKISQHAFPCGTTPNPFPLSQTQIVIFDDQENVELPTSVPPPPEPVPFPAETQRVQVGGPALPVAFEQGWIYVNLDTNVSPSNPPENPALAQGWIVVEHERRRKAVIANPAAAFSPSP